MGEHLLLVGMMGAGKSTVGAILGERTGRVHVDTDDEVERRVGASVTAIFSSRGEAGFRQLETDILREVLASDAARVVSVGGGAVLDPANRAAMRKAGAVVWLRARPDTLWSRVEHAVHRPLLGAPDGASRRAALEQISVERQWMYEEVATVTVDVDELEPGAVADQVLTVVGRTVP